MRMCEELFKICKLYRPEEANIESSMMNAYIKPNGILYMSKHDRLKRTVASMDKSGPSVFRL